MDKQEALRLFVRANTLWFSEGVTHQALALYQEAATRDPTDAVTYYQLARALWALEQYERARVALTQAERHRDRLSERGQALLTAEIQHQSSPPSWRFALPIPVSELDVAHLEAKDSASIPWLDIASVAKERQMYGLAAHALRRSGGGVHVRELDEDAREIEQAAGSALNCLYVMRTPEDQAILDALVLSPQPTQVNTPMPRPLSTALSAAVQPHAPKSTGPLGHRQACPLAVAIQVLPHISPVDVPLQLEVTLTNRSSTPVAVNHRMLLNHPSTPPEYGEVYLNVEGPSGYENMVSYHVRAGSPGPQHFGVLAPGQSVTKSYALSKYESCDLAGRYRIWVTYRNTVRAFVKGLAVFLGAVSSPVVAIERSNPRQPICGVVISR
jgi:hypothetical protein